jgi:hypothetical protein
MSNLWLGDDRVVAFADPERNGTIDRACLRGLRLDPFPRIKQWPEAQTNSEALEAAEAYEARTRRLSRKQTSFRSRLLGSWAPTAIREPFFHATSHAGPIHAFLHRPDRGDALALPPLLRMTFSLRSPRIRAVDVSFWCAEPKKTLSSNGFHSKTMAYPLRVWRPRKYHFVLEN